MPTALLKTLIVILFFAVLASLTSALFFLFKDAEGNSRKRALYALGTRITLAAMLLSLISYGVWSGQLTLGAPWHGK